ncbi:hypothetical protein GYMLUDRAFT_51498 [Collybiopsis luxurians FD-317 M1]|uniref:Uncharacterized protein n=1 Tax=Collybiopsis luxurians FD-317 M1 TaxID=944289 RepID=A0A0D0C4V4_9AGAR|nr:hypothetical protein GYMLUDRAFT_51498 [Collybiopsis luxurians FD-317 M1]
MSQQFSFPPFRNGTGSFADLSQGTPAIQVPGTPARNPQVPATLTLNLNGGAPASASFPGTPTPTSLFTENSHSPTIQLVNNSPLPAEGLAHIDGSTPAEVNLVIDTLTIDTLAADFKLNKNHRLNLHALVRIGSRDPPLSRSDLGTRLYMLAEIYVLNEMIKAAEEARNQGNGDLQSMFNDLKIHLEDTWDFSNEQQVTIRGIVMDLVIHQDRTNYCELFSVVLMTNIFGLPGRERKLLSHVRKVCSNVRNQLRVDIRNSIIGNSTKTLEAFTYDAAIKYKRGGPGEKPDTMLTIHNAILRRLAFENRSLLGVEETENEDESDGQTARPSKKRKNNDENEKRGGRIAKENHFWGRVDIFFKTETVTRGTDFRGEKWKQYIEDTVKWDHETFRDQPLQPQEEANGGSSIMDVQGSGLSAQTARAGGVPGAQGSALF